MARNLARSLSFQVYHKAQSLDHFYAANEVVFSNRKYVNLPNLCFGGNKVQRLNS